MITAEERLRREIDLRAVSREAVESASHLARLTKERDRLILAAHEAGSTDAQIAAACGLDRSRVTRIIHGAVGWRGQGRRKTQV